MMRIHNVIPVALLFGIAAAGYTTTTLVPPPDGGSVPVSVTTDSPHRISVTTFSPQPARPRRVPATRTIRPVIDGSLSSLRHAGDSYFTEESYSLAAQEYGQWLERASRSTPGRAEVEYCWIRSLGEAEQWDGALAAVNNFLYRHRQEPLWTARGEYWRGLLLQTAPSDGYQVGSRIYRGSNYPHLSTSVRPKVVNLEDFDNRQALASFQRAVLAFQMLPADQRRSLVDEESNLCFDLAQFLTRVQSWGSLRDWHNVGRTDWSLDPSQPYNLSWPQPKKSLFLLSRIPHLPGVSAHTALLAEVTLALFIQQNRENWVRRAPDNEARILQSLPYRQLDPVVILRGAADRYPQDPLAPQIRLMAATGTVQRGDLVSALQQDQQLLSLYPKSPWAADAKAAIQSMMQKQIWISTPGPQHAGQPAVVNVSTQNLKSLVIRAYRVPLDQLLTAHDRLMDPTRPFSSFPFSSIRGAETVGPKVAEWIVFTKDRGNHQGVSETVRTPLTAPGAYLVEATGDNNRVRSAALVLISDLAVIQKAERDSTLCYVADARTGQPVPNASVTVRNTYAPQPGANGRMDPKDRGHVEVLQGQTDAEGIYTAPRGMTKSFDWPLVETFATAPGSRYALTGGRANGWYGYHGPARAYMQPYVYTDRPVYRPNATVYFRVLLARRVEDGEISPLVGAVGKVTISNPQNTQVYTANLTSSPFGAINGSFKLPTGAPLGEYSMTVTAPKLFDSSITENFTRFRVEEYKRPEFHVSVTPSTTQARFGDSVTAAVTATYYSGGVVAGAKTDYKVFRSPYYPSYEFPQPYDWLYHPGGRDDANEMEATYDAELVAEGHAVTDANGNISIHFAAKRGSRDYTGDYQYSIQVDVVDASRRQVGGEGVLKVTKQLFFAYLKAARGFYQAGDKAQVEIRTEDANNNPVSAAGSLTVYRLTYDKDSKEIPTAVHTEPVATDADGKAFVTWTTEKSGMYRVEFESRDRFNTKVVGKVPVWVGGEDIETGQFRTNGVTLLTDKTTYTEGDTAHVLVVADKPDTWVLLTNEAGNQILNHRLVHVAAQTTTVDISIGRIHVPNFTVAAAAVKDYQFYSWQQDVFVPPVRQFLHVDVTGDKQEYRPGDTGRFQVKATDWDGQPVATEVSLGVVDSSLFYIQKEYAPDVRSFYYGSRRFTSRNAISSQQFGIQSRVESDFPTIRYPMHSIHLPGVGQLYEGNLQEMAWPFSNSFFGSGNHLLYAPPPSPGMPPGAGAAVMASSSGYPGGTTGGGATAGSMSTTTTSASAVGAFTPPTPNSAALSATWAAFSDGHSRMPRTGEGDEEPPGSFLKNLILPRLRRDFAETAFWTPAVVTSEKDGAATIDVKFPDSLTTWKASALGLTRGMQVGSGASEVMTNKRLQVRLEGPRFFVERDQVVLSAIVRNDLKTEKQVQVSLQTDPSVLTAPGGSTITVAVPSGGEKRIDWPCRVLGSGTARVRMTAETDEESDAVEQSFPALVHGVQKFVGGNGVINPGATTAHIAVNIPAAHQPGKTALLVQVNPSLAATALDALPYLADYPYGCVEQTMSRFLPSVVVARTLQGAGINLDTLRQRAALIRKREGNGTPFGSKLAVNAATDQSGYTYPSGTPGVLKASELSADLDHGDRWKNPVFDAPRLNGMVNEGLARLTSMQRSDGGWGWWPDSAESDPYMTGYVVYGLATARAAGVPLPGRMLERGYAYLAADMKNRFDQRDLAAWEVFALSHRPAPLSGPALRVLATVYSERGKLSPYGQALLALTLHNLGQGSRAEVILRNLLDTATIDRQNGTASWKSRYGFGWDWYNNDVETTAWILKAYTAIQPRSPLGPMLVRWLVMRLRGTAWSSTKETAIAVYALSDYIRVNRELDTPMTVTVALGNRISRTFRMDRENALLADNRFVVPDALLPAGSSTVTITRSGAGRLYYSSALQFFTTEGHIPGAGGLLKVQRRYYRLTPKVTTGPAPEGGTERTLDYTRQALPDGSSLKSGDLLESEMVIDAANDFDYVIFEDMKPAGCEPVDLRSGSRYGDNLCSNMELRDTKTAFFIDRLPQGTRAIRYRLRAEVPGLFHALPTNAYAMYAPDVRAISDEWAVKVNG